MQLTIRTLFLLIALIMFVLAGLVVYTTTQLVRWLAPAEARS